MPITNKNKQNTLIMALINTSEKVQTFTISLPPSINDIAKELANDGYMSRSSFIRKLIIEAKERDLRKQQDE